MKPVYFLLSACALIGVYSCQATQVAVNATNQDAAAKSYPLKINFQPEFVESLSQQGSITAGRAGIWQPWDSGKNMGGDGYYMILSGNSVKADLPYYGQRDLFRDVYEKPGILIDNKTIENITYGRSADNKVVALEFDVQRLTERFHVRLVIMPDKRAVLFLSSPQRQAVRYEGTVASL